MYVGAQQDRKVRIFSLKPEFVTQYKDKQPPWGPLGYFVYKRTYSKPLFANNPDGPTEEWHQTCQRVIEGVFNIQKHHCRGLGLEWKEEKAQNTAQEMYDRMFNFKFLPPGRGLWSMGTDAVMIKGGAILNNCGFTSTEGLKEDFADPFCFLMDMSMLGVGVGGDMLGAGKVKILVPRVKDETFVVEDSREGWVDLVRTVLNSFVHKGFMPESIDYSKVRPRGAALKGFGGTASGPGPLIDLVAGIKKILTPSEGIESYWISSVHIADIFNMIGKCVVAGGIRRSSEILLGDPADIDFQMLKDPTERDSLRSELKALRDREANKNPEVKSLRVAVKELAKQERDAWALPFQAKVQEYTENGEYGTASELLKAKHPGESTRLLELRADLKRRVKEESDKSADVQELESRLYALPLESWRWAANISLVASVGMDYTKVAESIAKNGEPGLFWLENARAYSRMGRKPDYKDKRAKGCNPCSEQVLFDKELCTLVETFPANHSSYEDYARTLKYAYLYAKTVTLVMTHIPKTNNVMAHNRRIGCSMSGIVQAIHKHGRSEFRRWCKEGYKELLKWDDVYSEWLGVPKSIKISSVKPSGCRPWYALTSTDQGLLTLEEMFKDHPEGQEWADLKDETYADGPGKKITRTYVNGTVPVNRITMSYHLSVESTLNHQWEVIGRDKHSCYFNPRVLYPRWVETKDITPGDILNIQPGVYQHAGKRQPLKTLSSVALKMRGDAGEIKQPEFMSPDLAWLLGYLWGDGAMSPSKWRLRWVDGRRENLQKASKVILDLFGLETEFTPASGLRKAWSLECASKMLWHWLIKNGVFKYDAGRLDLIPEVVRRSDQECIIAFIAGLIDADGTISKAINGGKAIITTADSRFAQHLQDVCWAVGLCFSRSHQTKGDSFQKDKSMWHLTAAAITDKGAFDIMVKHSVKASLFFSSPDFPGWMHERAERSSIVGKVLSNETAGEIDTYDVEVEEAHWYYAGAVKSHNTVSLLCGATPGVHFPHSQYYIRNIRVQNTSPLVQLYRDANYPVEKDRGAPDTSVLSFPVEETDFWKSKSDITMWEQLALVEDMQWYWSDNQVSATISFKPEEAKDIKAALETYETRLKSVSFLPLRDHGYDQAPYIEINEATYRQMSSVLKPVDLSVLGHEMEDKGCDGEACLLKAHALATEQSA